MSRSPLAASLGETGEAVVEDLERALQVVVGVGQRHVVLGGQVGVQTASEDLVP
jgi:hypothetical protein